MIIIIGNICIIIFQYREREIINIYFVIEPMQARDPVGILIPSVFVSEITGLIIKENYLYDELYFVQINDDTPFNITHLLLPFAIVVGICFLVMVIFMVSIS